MMKTVNILFGFLISILLFTFCENFKKTDSQVNELEKYSTCKTWEELVGRDDFEYAKVERISDPGTKENPSYTGFWFYDEFQFDKTDRYMLGMKVHFTDRDVQADDVGEIGYFDLMNNNEWTKIGETTA